MAMSLVLGWSDPIFRGRLQYLLTSGGLRLAFLPGNAPIVTGLFILLSKRRRTTAQFQFAAARCIQGNGAVASGAVRRAVDAACFGDGTLARGCGPPGRRGESGRGGVGIERTSGQDAGLICR